jgi:hypothetical protein
MHSLSASQQRALIESNATELQIAQAIAHQSKPKTQTSTLVVGSLLALLSQAVVPGLGPIVVLALTVEHFIEQGKKASKMTRDINRGAVWDYLPPEEREHFKALDPQTIDVVVNLPVDCSRIVDDVAAAQIAPPSAAAPTAPTAPPPPLAMPTPDCIADMGANVGNALIVGVPGSGKDLVTALTIAEVKKRRPELKRYCFDPKNDPKESGYYEGQYDVIDRFDARKVDAYEVRTRLASMFKDFLDDDDDCLFVINEYPTIANKVGKKWAEAFGNELQSVVQLGSSRNQFIWIVSQTGKLEELKLPASLRSSLRLLAIARPGSDAAIAGLMRTDLIADKDDQVMKAMMDRSPVGRAYYYGPSRQWQAMPTLKNLSGYDRDNRQWEAGHVPKEPTSPPTDFDATAIDRMAGHSFKVEETIEVKSEAVEVTPKDELLRYLVAVGSPKKVAEIRNGAKPPIRKMPSDNLRSLLAEMVDCGEVETDGVRFSSKNKSTP